LLINLFGPRRPTRFTAEHNNVECAVVQRIDEPEERIPPKRLRHRRARHHVTKPDLTRRSVNVNVDRRPIRPRHGEIRGGKLPEPDHRPRSHVIHTIVGELIPCRVTGPSLVSSLEAHGYGHRLRPGSANLMVDLV